MIGSIRGENTCVKLYNDQINISFIWAILWLKFYKVIGIKDSTTWQYIINFWRNYESSSKEISIFRIKDSC